MYKTTKFSLFKMEMRARAFAEEQNPDQYQWGPEEYSKTSKTTTMDSDLRKSSKLWRRVKHEVIEMSRVTINMLKGQGSKVSYLFIPAFISIFWLVICFVTTRNPNVTLEDQYIRVSHHKQCVSVKKKYIFASVL